MIEPKTFYRKLDFLQSRIDSGKTGKDFLFSIIKELEKTLGKDLNFINGCIYEKDDIEYFLISAPSKVEKTIKSKMSIDDPAIILLKKSMTYIYDRPVFSIDGFEDTEGEYRTNAAFTVNSPTHSWIFVFELKSGWIREEIDLCLNAIRTALNYRLVAESVKNELEQANQIQQSLLPMIPPEIPGYQIAARSQPAELVGGDLYDYYIFDENTFGLCIGDASGHGLPAALMVRDVITGLRMGLEKEMKIVYTLKKLNTVIYHAVYSAKFISLFYAELEKNGNIIYANAGHPSPLLFDGENFCSLEPTGLIIGAFSKIDISRSYTKLQKGGILILYTDGILERKNKRAELFEIERLKSVIAENKDQSADTILHSIFEAADQFGKGKKWEDDATVVVIKREK
jgi:sigma-B regulation protein RsbU (phosphoserine phosphatase)